ncbi:glycosyltransferase family 2 protein [Variovorax sp. EL159]|uniref:glycosyltransferase family 2 protein n=1 Tax=Variovorax sp. EL159 TaxID=1566270 RepID=UPI00210CC47C|nr:glycosyltransferase family 2 protein [Variovorax sp. EL159]
MRPTLPVAQQGRRPSSSRPAELTKAQLQARVRALEHQVQAMERSTSWRLTAPVRWASRAVQRLRGAQPAAAGIAGGNYIEWIAQSAAQDAGALGVLAEEASRWQAPPLISILMPTYNPRPAWLREAIASVRAQTYAHWELCIADDASTDPQVTEILDACAREDARIRWVRRPVNGHISEASNSALALAGGEWVVLMDHDDLLTPDALLRVAHELRTHADARMIYSDEDKIDATGRRYNPYFKPDWNVDLFLSQNMYSHLGAYQRALVLEVGGFRKGFEGAQDYDLALRCIERIAPQQIRHIPHVLYHWRAHAESTAQSAGAKPYAEIAGEQALNEHFERTGVAARSESTPYGYRTRLSAPACWPRVSLIIPTRDALDLVRQCIESIVTRSTYPDYEIVLVDNGSSDPQALRYFDELRGLQGFKVIRDDGEFNYAALNNTAVAQASGEIVALINNDIEVISGDWLEEMVSIALQPGVGAVGAKLLYPDDTVQHAGVLLGIGGIAGHAHKHLARTDGGYFNRAQLTQSFSAVTAACLVVRKSVYEEVGGLDAVNLKISYNDVDFCLRLREAGYRNVWTPYAELYHHESATRPRDLDPAQRERAAREEGYMKTRWAAVIGNDPAYSPHLDLDTEDFRLAWPPRQAPADGAATGARP